MQKFYLVWDESRHNLGISSIDRQHRELVEMVNELAEVIVHDCNCEKARQLMDQLLILTEDHFGHEEDLMRKHSIPGLASHAEAHAKLLREAAELVETLAPNDARHAVLIAAFLTDCVENHILGEDRALARHLRGIGIE